jgi:hypothetical protein
MMEDEDPRNEKPSVQFNQLDGTASFYFRMKPYSLPGKYKNLGDARKAAEDRCRSMGWRG